MKNKSKKEVTTGEEDLLRRVAEEAARRLTPIEIHSICVLLSMAFGTGTMQSRIFAWHANEMRVNFRLPRITNAVAGYPTLEKKMQILESALDKLGEEVLPTLIELLRLSPIYQCALNVEDQ